jgi:hypothetical protein
MRLQDNAETLALIEGKMGIITLLNGNSLIIHIYLPNTYRLKDRLTFCWTLCIVVLINSILLSHVLRRGVHAAPWE